MLRYYSDSCEAISMILLLYQRLSSSGGNDSTSKGDKIGASLVRRSIRVRMGTLSRLAKPFTKMAD